MLNLNLQNFFEITQQILEQYYLQPLDEHQERKINTKDGFIERTLHGAMHASRTATWSLLMHGLLEKNTPDYVTNSLEK